MKTSTLFLFAATSMTIAQGAAAATVGSLDAQRTYQFTTTSGEQRDQSINGNYYSNLREHLVAQGSTVVAGAVTVTAEYLAGVNLFITGTPTLNTNTAGYASADEQSALRDWVNGGGVAVLTGEMTAFTATANSWLGAFGQSISGNFGRGTGRFTASDNPLLDGVNEGSLNAIALNAGGKFEEGGAFDILARYGTSATAGEAAIIGFKFGNGYVIASGDSSPFTNERFTSTILDGVTPSKTATFVNNITGLADASPAPVPLPASLPLIAVGMGALGLMRRRRSA